MLEASTAPLPSKALERWTLQPLLLGFGFFILVVISVASIWLVNQSSRDEEQVAHTLDAQNKIALVLLHLRRAESAQRGYLITGQSVYVSDYNESARNTGPAVAEAKAATEDNPQQQASIARMEAMVAQKIAEMARANDLYDQGQRDAALALVGTGEGRNLIEQIRRIALDMLSEERRLLAQRVENSRNTNLWLLAVTLTGTAIIVLIGGLSIYLVQRNTRQREDAQRALQFVNANLEETIAERTADLREANNELQRFAYIVSHDLRSPLVNIMGFTTELEALRRDVFDKLAALRTDSDVEEKAKDQTLGQDFDEALDFIKTSIGKMDRLINSILKLSREGRREFRPEFINMRELLQSIADGQAHKAAELDAEIAIGDLPPVHSDRLALEQIFSNLVDNALKYLQDGKPGRISLRGRSTPALVIYEVEDNGRGIAADDHERIFDLFRRAGPQDRPGEGIGLAHVRALVRRLGGQMTLRSALGHGSTFIVTLPRRWMGEQKVEERTVA